MKLHYGKPTLPDVRSILKTVARSRRCQQSARELARVMQLVYAQQPKILMELGSFRGWHLWALSRMLLEPAQLISIDPLIGLPEGEHHVWEDGEVAERVKPHDLQWFRADSTKQQTLDDLTKFLDGRKIDFLFIDGNHEYDYVKSDFNMYKHLVSGFLLFHDVGSRPAESSGIHVRKFWQDEILPEYPNAFEILDSNYRDSYGIGVLPL